MKMTLNEVLENHKSLLKVSGKILPARFSYAVSKNLKKLETEVKLIQEEQSKLAREYCEKDEEGKAKVNDKGYLIFGDDGREFMTEYNEYLKTEIEVEVHKIPFAEIERTEGDRYDILSPAELAGIGFMIEEEV